MKNAKRLVSLLMAVTLIFSLSVSAFAEALSGSANYEAIIKVLDAEGKVIESAKTGDKIYVAVYFQKAGDSSTTIDIVKDASSSVAYEVDVPADVFADKDTLAGATEADFNTTAGSTKITDWTSDTGCFTIWNTIPYTAAAGVIDPATPVAKHEITAGAIGTYELAFYSCSVQSALVYANNVEMIGTTLTIEDAAPEVAAPAEDAKAEDVVAGDVVYDDAVKVGATINNPKNATEIGFEFIPANVAADGVVLWNKAAKAKIEADVIGEGQVTFNAALIRIPRAIETVKILSRAYAVVDGEVSYSNITEKELNF